MKKFFILLFIAVIVTAALAHQPVIVGQNNVRIERPEISRAFYGELGGSPRAYFITADKVFVLYLNLLVPLKTNSEGRYSARVYRINGMQQVLLADVKADSVTWQEFYEPFGGDHYLKGPEFKRTVPAGHYMIEVYSADNLGKYVLAVGEKEHFGPKEIVKTYLVLPGLKTRFFGDHILSFLYTPFGAVLVIIVGLLIFWPIRWLFKI